MKQFFNSNVSIVFLQTISVLVYMNPSFSQSSVCGISFYTLRQKGLIQVSGFSSGHSTETALLSVTVALQIAKADSKSSVLILLALWIIRFSCLPSPDLRSTGLNLISQVHCKKVLYWKHTGMFYLTAWEVRKNTLTWDDFYIYIYIWNIW